MNFDNMDVAYSLLEHVVVPEMLEIKQQFQSKALPTIKIPEILRGKISEANIPVHPGMTIAITAGSRMICNSVTILREIVSYVRQKGATPFLVPAMGSHGGATADGQLEMLLTLGISEESIGCPIYSSMDTVCIGPNDMGDDTYVDRYAFQADGVIVFNRIKPHSGFHGKCESGLVKMLAVGLGKQKGAAMVHIKTDTELGESIYSFGKKIIETLNIICGIGVIEDAYDQTAEIHVITKEDILKTDPVLREKALDLMPKIPFDSCDVIIVNSIGKNICGSGMDNNVVGKFYQDLFKGWIDTETIGVLDITNESHGNANGIGRADVISKRAFDKIDLSTTYPNAITTKCYSNVSIPIIMPTDELVFKACINGCRKIVKRKPRVVYIQDTLNLKKMWISSEMLPEANGQITVIHPPTEKIFDEKGDVIIDF